MTTSLTRPRPTAGDEPAARGAGVLARLGTWTATHLRTVLVAWLFVRKSPHHLERHAAHIAYLRDDTIPAD